MTWFDLYHTLWITIQDFMRLVVRFHGNYKSLTATWPTERRLFFGGSLAYRFRDYTDDSLREPPVDFGEAAGNERW
jgi:hypothetical protein